jgi:hypothetical protein
MEDQGKNQEGDFTLHPSITAVPQITPAEANILNIIATVPAEVSNAAMTYARAKVREPDLDLQAVYQVFRAYVLQRFDEFMVYGVYALPTAEEEENDDVSPLATAASGLANAFSTMGKYGLSPSGGPTSTIDGVTISNYSGLPAFTAPNGVISGLTAGQLAALGELGINTDLVGGTSGTGTGAPAGAPGGTGTGGTGASAGDGQAP